MMIQPFLQELIDRWKEGAVLCEGYGAHASSKTLAACAKELQTACKAWLDQPLTITEAEQEFRWSARFLREHARDGRLKTVKGDGPIRIRRGDLLEFDPTTEPTSRRRPALEIAG